MLAGYPETSLTWRALRVLPSVVPGSPVLPAYTTLEEAAAGAFGGAPEDAERLALLRAVPAGQELIAWYGAIEIALPFGPAVAAAGGTFVRDLVRSGSRDFADEALAVLGKSGMAEARALLADATEALDAAALAAVPHTSALADRLRALLPARAPRRSPGAGRRGGRRAPHLAAPGRAPRGRGLPGGRQAPGGPPGRPARWAGAPARGRRGAAPSTGPGSAQAGSRAVVRAQPGSERCTNSDPTQSVIPQA